MVWLAANVTQNKLCEPGSWFHEYWFAENERSLFGKLPFSKRKFPFCKINYYKIRWTFALNFSMLWEAISSTRKSVSSDIKTLRSWLTFWGCRDGAVVRALASHQCGPGSIGRHMGWVEFVGFSSFPSTVKTSVWLDLCKLLVSLIRLGILACIC